MNEAETTRTRLVALLGSLLSLSVVSCFLLHALIHISARSFHDTRPWQPLPWITSLCLHLRFVVLLLPLPWLAAAIWLIARNNASAFRLVAFVSTLVLTLFSASIFTFVALALPWLPIKVGLSPH